MTPEELLKEVGEPVAFARKWHIDGEVPRKEKQENGRLAWPFKFKLMPITIGKCLADDAPLFTSDQVAAAILKATGPLEKEIERLQEEGNLPVRYYQPNGKGLVYAVYGSSSIDFVEELRAQLAKAEQRVAEACALTYLEDYDLTDIAERVRAGEWRKFVKEG